MASEKNEKASVAPAATMMKSKMSPMGMVTRLIVVLLIVVPAGASVYFYKQMMELKNNPQSAGQFETNELVKKVGALIDVPAGETPTIATVNDPEKLKTQQFFSKAKQGDKVLIYTNAKKAILYSVTENKILEVAPLNIGNTATTPKTGETTTENPTPSPETSTDTNQ